MKMKEAVKRLEEVKQGCEVIASKPWSTNPNDDYLMVVLCKQVKDTASPYVVWDLNTTEENFGTGGGTYCATFEHAAQVYRKRGTFGN